MIMFLSFTGFGSIPILTFTAASFIRNIWATFGITIAVTALTLFVLGIVKGKLSGVRFWFLQGFVVLFNGFIAAAVAFLAGWGMSELYFKVLIYH